MATIVFHQQTGKRFLLVGTGYGAFKSSRPSFFGGSLFPHEEEGQIPLAAICGSDGRIEWVYTNELVVVEIDGRRVQEIPGIDTFSD